VIFRVLLLVTATVLLLTAVSSVLAPRELRSGRAGATLGAAASNPSPPAAPGDTPTLVLRTPRVKPLTVGLGDVVSIVGRSETDDVLDVPAFGVDTPVGPQTPGDLLLVADQVGRFPVVLRYSQRRVGTLVVTQP
jgi:hypothetical protein